MEIIRDIETIEDAGFDGFLNRSSEWQGGGGQERGSVKFQKIAGGRLSANSVLEVGPNIKIDGRNKRIIVNDGANDRILIGYQEGGF